jgi:chromosome segregation ATPase
MLETIVRQLSENTGAWAVSIGGLLTAGSARFIARLLGSIYGTYRRASIAKREEAVTLRENRADLAEEKAAATTNRLYRQLEKRVDEYDEEIAVLKVESRELRQQVRDCELRHQACEAEVRTLRDAHEKIKGELQLQSARIEYIHEACPNCPNRLADGSE